MYSSLLAIVVCALLSVKGLDGSSVRRGACVIQCSPGSGIYDDLELGDCPPEAECRSTGCGTMCYTVSRNETTSRDTRGACLMMCSDDVSCGMTGYSCVSNGCGKQCQLRADYKQPEGCPEFNCSLNCMAGYQRTAYGCDTCECAY